MLLRDIGLYLNVDDYDRDYRSNFLFRNRYICNFITRRLRKEKHCTDGFNTILVQGCKIPDQEPIVRNNNLIIAVLFDQEKYDSLEPTDCHEFLIGMLLEGLEKCCRYQKYPLTEIKGFIEEFRRGGYVNQWIEKQKLLRSTGLKAIMKCSLDTQKFVLTLKLERKGKVVCEAQILETEPDETCFAHKIKDVVLRSDSIVVTDKFGDPTFSLKLDSLAV